ncbi:MAG: HAD family hydrolase [Planctomycetes bacterium]|nr:HAD family hydrolase [Planctomycetota bacterium]
MGKIEGILLDFGGTLDSDGIYWYDLFHELCVEQGLRLDRAAFEEEAHAAGGAIARHADIRRLSHEGTVTRLFEALGERLERNFGFHLEPGRASRDFFDRCRPWLNENLAVVRNLAQNFQLGVVSNNWGNARGWCEEHGFLPYLKVVVDSALAGISKPRPEIFLSGLQGLGLPAQQVAYVGDRYHTDMVGARNVGMTTVWVRHPKSPEKMDDGVVDFVIPSLSGLLAVARSHWV